MLQEKLPRIREDFGFAYGRRNMRRNNSRLSPYPRLTGTPSGRVGDDRVFVFLPYNWTRFFRVSFLNAAEMNGMVHDVLRMSHVRCGYEIAATSRRSLCVTCMKRAPYGRLGVPAHFLLERHLTLSLVNL